MLRFIKRKRATLPVPALPDGVRVYVIGDVHGRLDLLERALALIEADRAGRAAADTQVILLGDLIDRGPQSAGVLALLSALSLPDAKLRFVRGNHEEAMVAAMQQGPRAMRDWLRYGGDTTLASYGIDAALVEQGGLTLIDAIHDRVPLDHLRFLRRFEDMVRIGDYCFVHAGVRPGVALDRQATRDLRWIREEFLDSDAGFGAMVVHGHSVTDMVTFRPNRIGIDTGAYASGRLSVLGLEGTERWVFDTLETAVTAPLAVSA